MHTSLVALALTGLLAPGEAAAVPSWQTDYAAARTHGRDEGKPLAVFIGSGTTGWKKLGKSGKLGKEVNQILSDHYICLYVNTASKPGQKLAEAFDLPDGLGLVISDHTGKLQAFHHEGDLSSTDLAHTLRRYADPDRLVSRTETDPEEKVSVVTLTDQPLLIAPAPVFIYPAPVMAAPAFGGFGSFGGGFGGGRGGC